MNSHPGVEQRWVEAFRTQKEALNKSCAEVLNRHREPAMLRFESLGIPDTSVEAYKYTDLSKVFAEHSFVPGTFGRIESIEGLSCVLSDMDVRKIFLINGQYVPDEESGSDWVETPSGLKYGSMLAAQKYAPELLARYNEQASVSEDAMVQLNTAFAQDGFFMYVPKGVQEEKPFQVTQVVDVQSDVISNNRNFVFLEEDASVRIIQCFHAFQEGACCSNTVSEFFVAEGADLRLLSMQSEHEDAIHTNACFVKQANRSKYYSVWMGLYGGTVRTNLFTLLEGENCESNAYGLFFANDRQLIDYYSVLKHKGPGSTSDQLFKGIVGDQAVGVFNGRIEVFPGAQKTAAAQTSRNVLLSPYAMVHAKPHLEIYADDVKCSHGATVGQVNEEALFYMQSRGIGIEEAKFLQLFGFANDIVERILIAPLRLQVAGQVNRRLRSKQPARCGQCRTHCC